MSSSPRIATRAARGTGAMAGRRSALPSAFENSRLVTGFGRLALRGPVDRARCRAPRAAGRPRRRDGSSGMYWWPPASGPPTPSLNGSSSCLSRPPSRVEHRRAAEDRDPQRVRARVERRRLPLGDHAAGPVLGVGRRLVDDRLAALAVVADRGLADEGPAASEGGVHPSTRFFVARMRLSGSVASPPRCQPLVDVLADQVDDRVDAFERGLRGALFGRLPCVPGDGRVARAGPHGVAGEADDLVTSREQRVARCGADQTGRAGKREHA